MKIKIGSDHAAYTAKEALKTLLRDEGHEIIDAGTDSEESCDYPNYAGMVAESVSRGEVERGILLCGTGIGMSIMANKFRGIRAALCHSVGTAEMSRAHNDANILCLGARILELELIRKITLKWLATPFEGGRHARRLEIISRAENKE
ncbi:MAG: ribose 5-phosphate isomerase B [Planctomycetes bacterium]|nr:ribose 5-phosphate isomerase B [Planctomycetota bacterium]